jgi:hypothetical protein
MTITQESNWNQLYRIAFSYEPKNHKHTRKEFTEYIQKHYQDLTETVKEAWQRKFLYINGWKELCVAAKFVDYISKNERNCVICQEKKPTDYEGYCQDCHDEIAERNVRDGSK